MLLDYQWKWLLLQGLTPIFGAAIFYTIWGAAKRVVVNGSQSFSFAWSQAIDPSGWLYGGVIIAVNSSVNLHRLEGDSLLFWMLVSCAVVCIFILIAAMNERGLNPAWKPPVKLTGLAIMLIALILFVGMEAVTLSHKLGVGSS